MMNKQMSNRELIIKITVLLLGVSLGVGILVSLYLKNMALHNLAQEDAKKTSSLVFEIMNTKMKEGWGKEDLAVMMKRLNNLKKGLEINAYRSPAVASLFGQDPDATKALKEDKSLLKAMQTGKQVLIVKDDDAVKFYYPIKATKECLECHINAKVGDVNGVLTTYFPGSSISIPLYKMTGYYILFLVIFLIIIFITLYIVLSKKIVKPLINFTAQIKEIGKNQNIKNRLSVETQISEITQLGIEFNNLLDTINYYYEKLILQLYEDSLTSLPNLIALEKDIKRSKNPTVVIFNINQFRDINNFYGYETGDFILKELSVILKDIEFAQRKTYRIGSDEFVWLLDDVLDFYDFIDVLEEIQEHHFTYKESDIRIALACGIASSSNRLMENASVALHQAKISSKPFEVYDNSMEKEDTIEQNVYWTKKLKEALDEDRIIIYFQPILDVKLKKANKFESLVRLQDRDGTIHSPVKFMDVAKLSRLYLKLTRRIIKKAFEYFKDKPYEFSVNVSMDDITDLPTKNYILDLLRNFPEPSRVVFEILETEEITEFNIVNAFATEVKSMGAKLAIDDFGSGFSNYDYIIKLNVDFLKIDSSLIKNIDTDEDIAIVVESIIYSAKRLGLKTIAEFVHSQEVMDKVKELGVDYIQGYHIDQPLSDISSHLSK